MKRLFIALVVLGSLVGSAQLLAGGSALRVAGPDRTIDTNSALVQLAGDPLSVSARTRPTKGKKVDFDSATVKSERARSRRHSQRFQAVAEVQRPERQDHERVRSRDQRGSGRAQRNDAGDAQLVTHGSPRRVEAIYQPVAMTIPTSRSSTPTRPGRRPAARPNAGAGVKVAVIDSGIDVTHPCFDDAGYAPRHKSAIHR